jgi:hypothetical protein
VRTHSSYQPEEHMFKDIHCRPELPGCVPKEIKYVVNVHIPKTGGSTVDVFLRQASGDIFKPKLCDMRKFWPQSFCSGRYSPGIVLHEQELSNETHKLEMCEGQKLVISGLHEKNVFEDLDCNTLALDHFDMSLVLSLPTDVLKNTLVIASLREPHARVLSTYYYLMAVAKGASQILKDYGLLKFVERGFIDEDTNNRMTKTLAGDYCCYSEPLHAEERWKSAVQHLRSTIGAVIITEQTEVSLQYVSWLLGFHAANTSRRVNTNPHSLNIDLATMYALERNNNDDTKLYREALRFFNEQVKAMNF